MTVGPDVSGHPPHTDLKNASDYAGRGMDRVDGWLVKLSARLIVASAEIQTDAGERGGVCEIGVHHGKLFILLYNCLSTDERGLAIDLFDDQAQNTDGSGRGDKEIFLRNLSRFSPDSSKLTIIEANSLKLDAGALRAEVGAVRLFSVDGGHTAECAESDLRLAEAALSPCGLVILDDVFNPCWPGVLTGLARYMADPATRLTPFLVSPNKVFLARPEAIALYRGKLRPAFSYAFEKESEMFDCPVDIYGVSDSLNKVVGRFIKRHAGDGAFERIRSIRRRILH
ncbi:MAG: class I SAM-dependent methyltransferase [Pseudomonadota bacterium]